MITIPSGKPQGVYKIATLNWEKDYPYCPEVSFEIWHTSSHLHIRYTVLEQTTKAEQTVLGGPVHRDSCVECFIQPNPEDPHYYNFEWNAAGKLAMACRTSRHDPQEAPIEVIKSVEVKPSLGCNPFAEREVGEPWTLEVSIPASALFNAGVDRFDGKTMKLNLYKCGDELKTPHFVTFAPVGTQEPDYHRPEFFVPVVFE